jgi:hypothetical protein
MAIIVGALIQPATTTLPVCIDRHEVDNSLVGFGAKVTQTPTFAEHATQISHV